jgi:hypothetical protein
MLPSTLERKLFLYSLSLRSGERVGVRGLREASEIMTAQLNGRFSAVFQQIFAAFCVLMTDFWPFLFFKNLASKFRNLLISDNSVRQTEIKRTLIQMSLYGHLTTSLPHQKTNFLKPFIFVSFVFFVVKLLLFLLQY